MSPNPRPALDFGALACWAGFDYPADRGPLVDGRHPDRLGRRCGGSTGRLDRHRDRETLFRADRQHDCRIAMRIRIERRCGRRLGAGADVPCLIHFPRRRRRHAMRFETPRAATTRPLTVHGVAVDVHPTAQLRPPNMPDSNAHVAANTTMTTAAAAASQPGCIQNAGRSGVTVAGALRAAAAAADRMRSRSAAGGCCSTLTDNAYAASRPRASTCALPSFFR